VAPGSRPRSARGGVVLAGAVTLVAVLAVLAAAAFVAAPAVGSQTLVVTDDNGTELLATPVDDETEVAIVYTHSVEKTTVRDVYVPSDDGLVATRMEFSSFGAGLPSGANVTERDGRYVYRPPATTFKTLRVKTGPIADHDLLVGGDRYDLSAMSGDGAVELTVERRLAPWLRLAPGLELAPWLRFAPGLELAPWLRFAPGLRLASPTDGGY
jgi:hypothetical protein